MKIYNKNAKKDFYILETLEAGIALSGAEVKSVRLGRVDLNQSYAKIIDNEAFLINAYIYPFSGITSKDYETNRTRKLLLHKDQIKTLIGKTSAKAVTLVPLALYSTRNLIKIELALAGSKKKYDHKKALKEKDEKRRLEQELRSAKNDLRRG